VLRIFILDRCLHVGYIMIKVLKYWIFDTNSTLIEKK
jgi:hypothetical protein